MISVLHVITALDVGGAELMLKRLIEAHQGDGRYRHSVISLKGTGNVGQQLRDVGVEVQSLEMRSAWDFPGAFWRLVQLMRERRPDVVQTWLYHADLIGGMAARLAGIRGVIWSVRCTDTPNAMTQVVVRVCGLLSRYVPQVIVSCAESACEVHAARGYAREKMMVVPNGYDLSGFPRSPELRREMREAFGFREDEVVVGAVGRFDPQKDYRNFVQAAARLAASEERVSFLMVGRGIDAANESLKAWLGESGCADRFFLAGERNDVPKLLAGLDMLCLSSCGEAFPNVVCEAMAAGVPCVVTDVGDAARIVADTGVVVAPRNAQALAEGLRSMIAKGAEERARLGELARRRVEERYSIGAVAAQFEAIYERVAEKMPSGTAKVAVTH